MWPTNVIHISVWFAIIFALNFNGTILFFCRYHEIFFMIDTCQAESMYQKFYSPNILAVASSHVGEDSLSVSLYDFLLFKMLVIGKENKLKSDSTHFYALLIKLDCFSQQWKIKWNFKIISILYNSPLIKNQ